MYCICLYLYNKLFVSACFFFPTGPTVDHDDGSVRDSGVLHGRAQRRRLGAARLFLTGHPAVQCHRPLILSGLGDCCASPQPHDAGKTSRRFFCFFSRTGSVCCVVWWVCACMKVFSYACDRRCLTKILSKCSRKYVKVDLEPSQIGSPSVLLPQLGTEQKTDRRTPELE